MDRIPHCNTRKPRRPAGALALAALCLCIPSVAMANAGTPLMWAESLHLTVGNLLIGIVEGMIIAVVFKTKRRKAVLLMIAANYFSMWAGLPILAWLADMAVRLVSDTTSDPTFRMIQNARQDLVWAFVLTYLVTLIFEWPFIVWILRRREHWFRASILASLLVQTLSYAALVVLYLTASQYSFLTNVKVVRLSEMEWPERVSFYYIDPDHGNVIHWREGQKPEKVAAPNPERISERLTVSLSGTQPERWDLIGILDQDTTAYSPSTTTLLRDIGGAGIRPDPSGTYSNRMQRLRRDARTHLNFGRVPRLGSARKSTWTFRTGFWPVEGLSGSRRKDKQHPTDEPNHIRIAMETPFLRFAFRNATHLPDDLILTEIWHSHICLLDPVQGKMALVVKGHGPAAVIDE